MISNFYKLCFVLFLMSDDYAFAGRRNKKKDKKREKKKNPYKSGGKFRTGAIDLKAAQSKGKKKK